MDPHALLLSIAVAIEPLPVLAGVLFLTAERGRPKAVAFLLGWLLALGVCALATVLVASKVSTPEGSTSSTVSAVLDLLLGVALAVWAYRQRPRRGDAAAPASTPGWMAKLDSMRPAVAFGLGLFLPPYVVAVAIGNAVVQQGAPTGRMVASVVLYATIASLGVLVPILITVVQPERSGAVLTRWRAWLEVYWPAVLFWLLVVLAVYLGGKGLWELLG